MWNILKKLNDIFNRKKNVVRVEDVTNSTVDINVYPNATIVNRDSLEISTIWFQKLLTITYDEEIKSKYIPQLHQSNDFEKNQLEDILNFDKRKKTCEKRIEISWYYLKQFKDNYEYFKEILSNESITIINNNHILIRKINELYTSFQKIEIRLRELQVMVLADGYELLEYCKNLPIDNFHIDNPINTDEIQWTNVLDKEPLDKYLLFTIAEKHNQFYFELKGLVLMIHILNRNNKIISGNAGSGKTHISAHIINSVSQNGDYVIFFKPKQFNGDNVNFETRILQILNIPNGYTLDELLTKINLFAKSDNKRCFLVIDALNETTKATIGFSNIWQTYLQTFINKIGLYSHIYFICTLRTSYVENIWTVRPSGILEIKGFQKSVDLLDACQKYFNYYRIKVLNFETADFSYFKTPLLLDLFCKLANEDRKQEIQINLDINTYLEIFQNYISRLVGEVKSKLNLQKSKSIVEGLSNTSEKFLLNNEAIISIDSFSDCFDKDDTVSQDQSIAKSVLEGYLIFIKDIEGGCTEIIKHTQQEVGGYLLAKKLKEANHTVQELLQSSDFREKIIGKDITKHHQLRLDILKFLIALDPSIILQLKDIDSIKLSWWYLYNGISQKQDLGISEYLFNNMSSKLIIEDILNISLSKWDSTSTKFNFHFISSLLEKLDTWEFDEKWTFFIYKEADSFLELINNSIQKIRNDEKDDILYLILKAKLIAFVTATTIRELRDLATLFLIEFGKKYPLELLEITEYSSTLKDSYIYERLASSCYGVALILQNKEEFVFKQLPVIASRLYSLQFSDNPKSPVFNYIVIDSIKHLIDLSVFKKVCPLNDVELIGCSNFSFFPKNVWTGPTLEQSQLINRCGEMSWPEPIGMDFGIYTIPRLIPDRNTNSRKAIANVYARICEFGYKDIIGNDFKDEEFRNYYWGTDLIGFDGKIDRLGKKYSWNAFYDYAGYLLLNKKLNVFRKDDAKNKHYIRLSDVDIDISLPSKDYKIKLRLYNNNLLAEIGSNPKWQINNQIDHIKNLFEYTFQNDKYIMLHGMIDQKLSKEYHTRSFILLESFFIKKDLKVDKFREKILDKVLDWDGDIHISPDRLSHVYFGELYWGNNICERSLESVSVKTGDISTISRVITSQDVMRSRKYKFDDIGKLIDVVNSEYLTFESEPTLAEYLWESNSIILKGHSEYFPSIKMGKSLNLVVEPITGKILDQNLNECFICIDYEGEDHYSNNFNYMRADLLRRYMADNNLVLVYQVKQHSYDASNDHNRTMKYFILE